MRSQHYQKLMAQVRATRIQTALKQIYTLRPICGRDYDYRLTIGNTEYFYLHGGVAFSRLLVES
ncbi:hypothetical protein BM613_12095 [Sulfoacidibacillus thermotolerans]|uniref:Uncharacterized protein n=1 Tax=Sulfoacidibacillus thermotolerans TaxID=1765684 RepID=A0A2U3D651_SULT2|nr:hypothetical protein BM613_12095 [Sulfoacidibacillus thermotolerans]